MIEPDFKMTANGPLPDSARTTPPQKTGKNGSGQVSREPLLRVDSNERGVLSCCGKKLRWRFLEESRVLEVTCGECGTRYLMGHDDALDDTREWTM